MRIISRAIVVIVSIACGISCDRAASSDPPAGPTATAPPAPAGTFSPVDICKGTIAVVMGRSRLPLMKATMVGDEPRVSYVKDGTTWSQKCKVEASTVTWGAADGRWRFEDHIEYSAIILEGSPLLIVEEKYPDGTSTKETFTAQDLK